MLLTKEVETRLNGKKIKYYKELGYELPLHKTKDGMRVPRGSVLIVKIENQFQREDIKERLPKIMFEKYGYEHAMKVPEIKERAMKNMSDNNGIACSKQQKYLHELFGGKLNYVDESTRGFALDIAFPESKIMIEYGGSGHALQVIFKNMTQKQFDHREVVRYQILKKKGWKQMTINSLYDYLPSDEVLKDELNKALEWFKVNDKGHSHYTINIGKPKTDNTYGKLRKIKEEDLIKEVS